MYVDEPPKDGNIPDFNISKIGICPFRTYQRSFRLFHGNFSKDIHLRSRLLCFTQNDYPGQTEFKICPFLKWAQLYNRYAHVCTRTRDVAKFRPLDHHNSITRYIYAAYMCGRLRWLAVFDHHSTTRFSAVAITETAHPLLPPIHDLYVLMSGNTLVKRRTRLLHNIWRHSFPIVETTFFQRWKAPYLTFDSTLIQRLTTPLSNVGQYSYLTFDNTLI